MDFGVTRRPNRSDSHEMGVQTTQVYTLKFVHLERPCFCLAAGGKPYAKHVCAQGLVRAADAAHRHRRGARGLRRNGRRKGQGRRVPPVTSSDRRGGLGVEPGLLGLVDGAHVFFRIVTGTT